MRRPQSAAFNIWILFYIIVHIGFAVLCFSNFIGNVHCVEDLLRKNAILLILGGFCAVINVLSTLAVWHLFRIGFYVLAVSIVASSIIVFFESSLSFFWIIFLIIGYITTHFLSPDQLYFE
ncbi:hypothetical protein J7L67_06920 [bacterium]|nr:hypothetical protein [bacterium]